ncbi:hypothetical protein NPIL_667261 [Nephila pilipes]|uniref:Uncharacterized protein n=1 Tax=Nephila pilipes TaxID=299642 RepID=A0A8X6NQL5_NEPPI|nr:hypothetical protein NPIL_667261 [Nephila pilipes]
MRLRGLADKIAVTILLSNSTSSYFCRQLGIATTIYLIPPLPPSKCIFVVRWYIPAKNERKVSARRMSWAQGSWGNSLGIALLSLFFHLAP